MKDFFISYSSHDLAWADWIAWELDTAGYEFILQRWDFKPGTNFVHAMQMAIKQCRRLLLVLSNASLKSEFVEAEWTTFFAANPSGNHAKLVPVRVDDCHPPGLLAQIVYIDLNGINESAARDRLLSGIDHKKRNRPITPPMFPGISDGMIAHSPPFPAADSDADQEALESDPVSIWTRSKFPSIRRRQFGRAFTAQQLDGFIKQKISDNRKL